MGTVRLTIQDAARAAGVENPFALSKRTGIVYAICHRLWSGQQTRIDLPTLAKLCDELGCQPGELLTYEKDGRRKTDKG